MKLNRAYKFRIYPTKGQEELILKTFGCVRFVYNKMLNDKIQHYEQYKETITITPAKYKLEYDWLREVDSYALCNAQMNLETAFKNFFRSKNVGFPKFKSKKNSKQSYTTSNVNNVIRVIDDSHINLPKLKHVKCKIHRSIPVVDKIKSATISKTASGKYYIALLTEYEAETPLIKLDKSNSLGLDYSSSSFYVDSQGNEANYSKFYRNAQRKLSIEQRKLAKMVQGSNNYNKQKIKIAKLHEHISNQRIDFLHKLSTDLANSYDVICVEDINLKNMSQCLNLGKSTMDNGFGMFRTFLEYKLNNRGKKLVKIDKWFPSSKMCRFCGAINTELKLSERIWYCDCGHVINRDHNAAINILNQGLLLVD